MVKAFSQNVIAADEITGKAYDTQLIGRLLFYVRPYIKLALLGLFLGFVAIGLNIAMFRIEELVVADLHPTKPLNSRLVAWVQSFLGYSGNTEPGAHLAGLSLLLLVIVGLLFIAETVHFYCLQLFGQKVVYDIRIALFAHIMRLPIQFYQQQPVGRLVTRISNDIQSIQEFIATGLIDISRHLFLMVAISITLLFVSWKLGWVALAVLPFIIVATAIFQHFARRFYRRVRKEVAELNAFLGENIRGMEMIQLLQREQQQQAKFMEIAQRLTQSSIASIRTWAFYAPTISIFKGICLAMILYLGTHYVTSGQMELRTLSLFIWLIGVYFDPVRHLAEKYNILQSAMASCERLFKILDTPVDPTLSGGNQATIPMPSPLEIQNVSFGYDNGQEILHNIQLRIEPGQKVALVGHTGAGKSTLIKLLMRFYDPTAGQIMVDGHILAQIPANQWRQRLAVVPQSVFLFRGSILDNIRLGNPDIPESEVAHAAQTVFASRFIEKYPERYDHWLEEGARTISAGERQLLSFARALVYRPDILILDEATSLMDTQTERLVQEALEKLLAGRTCIIIAHRLSTIQNADQIIVMHQGRIVESGTHAQLLAQKGRYHELYQLQVAG